MAVSGKKISQEALEARVGDLLEELFHAARENVFTMVGWHRSRPNRVAYGPVSFDLVHTVIAELTAEPKSLDTQAADDRSSGYDSTLELFLPSGNSVSAHFQYYPLLVKEYRERYMHYFINKRPSQPSQEFLQEIIQTLLVIFKASKTPEGWVFKWKTEGEG